MKKCEKYAHNKTNRLINLKKFLTQGILLFFLFFATNYTNSQSKKDSLNFNLKSDSINNNITITAVGDIMFGTNFPSKKYLPKNEDCIPLIEGVKDFFNQTDIIFGNLEGCISDNAPARKRCNDPTKCYLYRMPKKFGNCLEYAGFNLISLANNHTWDFGEKGVEDTKSVLDSLGINYAGLDYKPYTIFDLNENQKIGFCSFAPNYRTPSLLNIGKAQSIVKELTTTCDVVIVSFHGGGEGSEYQNVTKKTEKCYGENRGNVYEFSHAMIDAGADVIIGHGPHVTRAIEIYKNKFIAYSLGNFCTYGRFRLSGPNGIAPILQLEISEKGEFVSGKITPIKQINGGYVKLDNEKKVIKKVQDLTNTDFPEQVIIIDNEGNISVADSVPFENKQEGNSFRVWLNDNYPAYAQQIQLDRDGSYNNSYITKAYQQYGAEYNQAMNNVRRKK